MKICLVILISAFLSLLAIAKEDTRTLDPITIRSWLSHDVISAFASHKISALPPVIQEPVSIQESGRFIDLGKSVKQLAYSPNGLEIFGLLENSQTLVHLQSGIPPKLIAKYELEAPTESLIVVRGFLILLQQELGRIEIRPLSDLNSRTHWKPAENTEVRGVGLSPKEERAPLIIWTRGKNNQGNFDYNFEFLDAKTFKKLPWEISEPEPKLGLKGNQEVERVWDNKLSTIKVSESGQTAETDDFSLEFLKHHKVRFVSQATNRRATTDHQKFQGRELPFNLSGRGVFPASENYWIAAFSSGSDPQGTILLDSHSLVPLCMISGLMKQSIFTNNAPTINSRRNLNFHLNELGGELYISMKQSDKLLAFKFDPRKIEQVFPSQSCPTRLELKKDETGIMKIPFAETWQGQGHRFKLTRAPLNTTIDPDTGLTLLPIPPNQNAGSGILVQAEGHHRDGFKIAFSCVVEVPYQK